MKNNKTQKLFNDLYVFNSNNMQNNAYILIKNKSCIIIDPSSYYKEIKDFIKDHNLELIGILLTHGHYDHIGCSKVLAKDFDVKVYCYKPDEIVVKENLKYAKEMTNLSFDNELNEFNFFNDEELKIGGFKFKIYPTSGHTIGGICILYNEYFFTGDTLFIVGIGRSDFPTGNELQLYQSLRTISNICHDNWWILCGHDNQYEKFKDVKETNLFIKHFMKRK